MRRQAKLSAVIVTCILASCGGERSDSSEDIPFPPVESTPELADQPQMAQPATQPQQPPTQPQPPATRPQQPATRPSQPAPSRPAPRVLPAGTVIELAVNDTITSRRNKAGDAFTALATADVKDAGGRVLVAAGTVFHGVIEVIKEAESPGGQGTLVLAFRQVEIGNRTYDLSGTADSLGTQTQGRGVTGGDVAKVGVGAAAGAVAGRVLGGNVKGAVIGGVVGAAAGAGIAAATKDSDIVLPAGGLIRLVLSADLQLEDAR